MFGSKKERQPRDNIEAAKDREIRHGPSAAKLALRYLSQKRRPKNAPKDTYPRTAGREARDWPLLDTSWLSDFPGFPFHVEGLRCSRIGQGIANVSAYLRSKDRPVVSDLVLLADSRLAQAFDRWPLPEFAHATPAFYGRDERVVTWPADYAELHINPYTRKGNVRKTPFRVTIQTPIWRRDGFFDQAVLDVKLDAECSPVYVASECRPYSPRGGTNRIVVNSYLDGDGEWRFHWVESDVPRHRKTYIDPKDA